jgi:hypothetical protein
MSNETGVISGDITNDIIRMEGLTKVYDTGEIKVIALHSSDLAIKKANLSPSWGLPVRGNPL